MTVTEGLILLKQIPLFGFFMTSEVLVCKFGYFPPSWSSFHKSFFYEEWFIYLLYCAPIFTQSCGNRRDTYRASFEFIDNDQQYFIIDFIESVFIDIQSFKCIGRYFFVDAS